MEEIVNNEISNLFQELIVSKIKNAIDELSNRFTEVENFYFDFEEKIDKVPKKSEINKMLENDKEDIINHINECVKVDDVKKYLIDIVNYLKKQFGFSDNQALCQYMETVAENIGNNIELIINEQKSLWTKIDAVEGLISTFVKELANAFAKEKENVLTEVNKSLSKIINLSEENKKQLYLSTEESGKIKGEIHKLSVSIGVVETINSADKYSENRELSVRELICETNKRIDLLNENLLTFKNDDSVRYSQMCNKLKILTIIGVVLIIGIILLLLLLVIFL